MPFLRGADGRVGSRGMDMPEGMWNTQGLTLEEAGFIMITLNEVEEGQWQRTP